MTPNSPVTSTRPLAGVFVTEFVPTGSHGPTMKERTGALTLIAHPQFRDELNAAAELLGR